MDGKEYTVVGKVEIGTDEYRDLIVAVTEHRADSDKYRNKWLDEERKNEKLNKEIETLKEYKAFVTEKHLDSFRLWKLEKSECDAE